MKEIHFFSLIVILATFTIFGCHNDDGENADNLNLGNMPNPNAIIGAGGGTPIKFQPRDARSITVGIPPAFSTLQPQNLNDYFTGDVQTLVNVIQDGSTTNSVRENKIREYFQGKGKCWIAQGAAEQLGHLNSATTSICYMTKFPTTPGVSIQHVSGEEIPAENFFAQQDTTVIRKMKILEPDGPDDDEPGSDPGEDDDDEGVFNIFFEIKGKDVSPNSYDITLHFCSGQDEGNLVHHSDETISFNRETKILTITHKETGRPGQSGSEAFESVFSAKVKKQSDSTFDWDYSQKREMTIKGRFDRGIAGEFRDQSTFNGHMSVTSEGDQATVATRFFHNSQFTDPNGKTGTNSSKGYSIVEGIGSNITNFAVLTGAGKHEFNHAFDGKSFENHAETIGFEYNETLSPKYTTITSGTLFNTVNASNFSTDDILSLTTSAPPSTTGVGTFNCATSEINSEHILDMGNAAGKAISKKCEQRFSHSRNLCYLLDQCDNKVFSKVNTQPE